jgi:hypothetical protein
MFRKCSSKSARRRKQKLTSSTSGVVVMVDSNEDSTSMVLWRGGRDALPARSMSAVDAGRWVCGECAFFSPGGGAQLQKSGPGVEIDTEELGAEGGEAKEEEKEEEEEEEEEEAFVEQANSFSSPNAEPSASSSCRSICSTSSSLGVVFCFRKPEDLRDLGVVGAVTLCTTLYRFRLSSFRAIESAAARAACWRWT